MRKLDPRREGGSALFVAMMLLILLGLVGFAALETVTRDQQVAGFQNHKRVAFYAAEAGLVAAVQSLETTGAAATSGRAGAAAGVGVAAAGTSWGGAGGSGVAALGVSSGGAGGSGVAALGVSSGGAGGAGVGDSGSAGVAVRITTLGPALTLIWNGLPASS